jgi:hypothetical protein
MRRFLAAITCSVLLTFALAACGGSSSGNGVEGKSPNQIVSAASGAVANVSSVHVSGAIPSGGAQFTLDLSLVNGKGGRGSVAQGGLSFQLVALNQQLYINGSPTFWRQFGGAAAAQQLSGKWLKAPTTGQFAALAMLIDARRLFGQLLANHGTLTKGQVTTVRGQKVVPVTDTARGGTLYVATTGKPYPIEIVKNGTQGGQVTFDQFNQPVTLSAPPNAVDVSQVK